jgi:hypothetical protein
MLKRYKKDIKDKLTGTVNLNFNDTKENAITVEALEVSKHTNNTEF